MTSIVNKPGNDRPVQKNNAIGHKDDILLLFRKVAIAKNTDAFIGALQILQSSEIWKKNQKPQKYFDRVWYPHHKVILVNIISSYIMTAGIKKRHSLNFFK